VQCGLLASQLPRRTAHGTSPLATSPRVTGLVIQPCERSGLGSSLFFTVEFMNHYLWSSVAAAALLTSSLGVASAEASKLRDGAEELTDPLSAVETIADVRTVADAPSQELARAAEPGASARVLDTSVLDGLTDPSNDKFSDASAEATQGVERVATAAISTERILVPFEPPLVPPPSPVDTLAVEEAPPEPEFSIASIQSGIASWYGPGLHGNRSASGEVFNQNALTAAHRSLPFGTRVRVVNENNGRSVVVRINDRGPFTGNRVIDLSRAAAAEVGMIGSGTARVRLEILR